uniref:LisH domain-containing protein n=1 Tax=Parascaris univalens TaxID=6257 RepID=A0A914ZZE8_PARUN
MRDAFHIPSLACIDAFKVYASFFYFCLCSRISAHTTSYHSFVVRKLLYECLHLSQILCGNLRCKMNAPSTLNFVSRRSCSSSESHKDLSGIWPETSLSEKELLRLIHQHLIKQGLKKSTAQLQQEADLPDVRVSRITITPTTAVASNFCERDEWISDEADVYGKSTACML